MLPVRASSRTRRPRTFGPVIGSLPGLALIALLAGPAAAQETGTVTGEVINITSGQPLIGAQVSIPGTGIGGLTNNVGRYLLPSVPAGVHTLRVQSIGYDTQSREITVEPGATTVADFALDTKVIQLEGIVATGQAGAARQREVGVSISQVPAAEIDRAAVISIADVLQGRSTGTTVLTASGMVGAGSTIKLRGNSSINSNNEPLVYIDGVRMDNSPIGGDFYVGQAARPLGDINPENIARIEIIKGPAATTLYGSEAAGGVIQIFTKSGAEGDAVWSLSIDQGIYSLGHIGPEEDASGLNLSDCTQDPVDPTCPADGSWLRNGHLQEYNLSVRGGLQEMTYFVSGTWGGQEGVIAPQHANNYSMRANFSFNPMDALDISINNLYAHREIRWIPDGNALESFMLNALRGGKGYTPQNKDGLILDGLTLASELEHFITGATVRWTPGAGFSQRLTLGMDWSMSDFTESVPLGYWEDPLGYREARQEHNRRLTFDYVGTWAANLDELGLLSQFEFLDGVSSSFSWGAQFYNDYDWGLDTYGEQFAAPGDDQLVGGGTVTSAGEIRQTVTSGGFFIQERLGFNDVLFLTGGVRWDGFSTFGRDFGLATYPKLSVSYIISDHAFWPDWWETMKLRGAIGEAGRAPGVFAAARTFAPSSGDENEPALVLENVGSPNLGPEVTREAEGGFDASLLDGRVGVRFTYYHQRTYDALVAVTPTPSDGISESVLRNVGTFENQGIEFALDLSLLRLDNVRWDVGGQFSTQNSEVIEIGALESIPIGGNQFIRQGYPIPAYFGPVAQNANAVGEEPIYEEEYLGTTYPSHTYAINTTLTLFDRLTFDVLGEAQGGHVLNAAVPYQNMFREVWPPCNDVQAQIDAGNTDQVTAGQLGRCHPILSTRAMWTLPADFFKLRNASVTYRLPEDWLPGAVRSMSIALRGSNLFKITDWPGLDPEAIDDGSRGGLDLERIPYYVVPPGRRYMLNVSVNF